VHACAPIHIYTQTDRHADIEQIVFSVVSVKAALLFHFDIFLKTDWIFEYEILYKG
jgi:hypothetical protein